MHTALASSLRPSGLIVAASLLAACGGAGTSASGEAPPPKAAPTERYLSALDRKVEGDSQAYFNELVSLAHDEPDSRAGRRARAMLQGDDFVSMWAMAGVIAAVAVPNYMQFANKAKQSEAKASLQALYVAQKAYFAEWGRYCRTFAECGYEPPAGGRFVYFLSPKEVTGAVSGPRDPFVREALGTLTRLRVAPKVGKGGFVAAAVANLDADDELDVWSIDESGDVVNLTADLAQ